MKCAIVSIFSVGMHKYCKPCCSSHVASQKMFFNPHHMSLDFGLTLVKKMLPFMRPLFLLVSQPEVKSWGKVLVDYLTLG